MKSTNRMLSPLNLVATAGLILASPASAAVIGQLGVLDSTANGGINPATTLAWAPGDQYRLAFYTEDKRDALSNDIEDYNIFVQSVAAGSAAYPLLGNGSWKVLGSTATTSAQQNTGTVTNDGIPIYVLDGITQIAADSADMWNGFTGSSGSNVRIESGPVVYAPYLNEEGGGDSGTIHGVSIATGSNSNGTISSDPLGDPNNDGLRLTYGASNANNSGRVFARFGKGDPSADWSFYALSDPLTVVPEPSTVLLGSLGCLALWRRRRK